MAEKSDLPLDTIGLSAQLEGSGISVGVRTRLTTAIDKLVGNIIDLPNRPLEAARARSEAKLKAELAEIEARSDVNVSLIKGEGAAALAKLLGLNDAGVRILEGFIRETERKIDNKSSVVIEAIEEIKRLPPPTDDLGPEIPLDGDWLNVFGDYSEKASGEELRLLWARILAGEIRKPKSFSRTTLRVLSEVDGPIAEAFERVLSHRVGDAIIIDDADSKFFADLLFLEEFGLVFGADGTLGLNMSPQADGFVYSSHENLYLRMKPKVPDPKKFIDIKMPVSAARLSRVGVEIAAIIPKAAQDVGLRVLARKADEEMDQIDLCRREGDKGFLVERLK